MKQKKQKNMKKIIVTWVAILLVLVIGIAVFLWSQGNNLDALRYTKYTPEERQLLLEENQLYIDEILSTLPIGTLHPLTREQEKMLWQGEITEEEALEIIMGNEEVIAALEGKNQANRNGADTTKPDAGNGKSVAAVPESKPQPGGSTSSGGGVQGNNMAAEENGELQELMANVYLLRSTFTGKIDGLIEQAKQEYINKMKTEGKANKATIGTQYMAKGAELEKECDAQMESLLSKIADEIEEMGGDTSTVDEIRTIYETEKSIKKADLVAKYAN